MARRWIDVDDKTDDGGTDNEDLRNNGGGIKADGEDFKEMIRFEIIWICDLDYF